MAGADAGGWKVGFNQLAAPILCPVGKTVAVESGLLECGKLVETYFYEGFETADQIGFELTTTDAFVAYTNDTTSYPSLFDNSVPLYNPYPFSVVISPALFNSSDPSIYDANLTPMPINCHFTISPFFQEVYLNKVDVIIPGYLSGSSEIPDRLAVNARVLCRDWILISLDLATITDSFASVGGRSRRTDPAVFTEQNSHFVFNDQETTVTFEVNLLKSVDDLFMQWIYNPRLWHESNIFSLDNDIPDLRLLKITVEIVDTFETHINYDPSGFCQTLMTNCGGNPDGPTAGPTDTPTHSPTATPTPPVRRRGEKAQRSQSPYTTPASNEFCLYSNAFSDGMLGSSLDFFGSWTQQIYCGPGDYASQSWNVMLTEQFFLDAPFGFNPDSVADDAQFCSLVTKQYCRKPATLVALGARDYPDLWGYSGGHKPTSGPYAWSAQTPLYSQCGLSDYGFASVDSDYLTVLIGGAKWEFPVENYNASTYPNPDQEGALAWRWEVMTSFFATDPNDWFAYSNVTGGASPNMCTLFGGVIAEGNLERCQLALSKGVKVKIIMESLNTYDFESSIPYDIPWLGQVLASELNTFPLFVQNLGVFNSPDSNEYDSLFEYFKGATGADLFLSPTWDGTVKDFLRMFDPATCTNTTNSWLWDTWETTYWDPDCMGQGLTGYDALSFYQYHAARGVSLGIDMRARVCAALFPQTLSISYFQYDFNTSYYTMGNNLFLECQDPSCHYEVHLPVGYTNFYQADPFKILFTDYNQSDTQYYNGNDDPFTPNYLTITTLPSYSDARIAVLTFDMLWGDEVVITASVIASHKEPFVSCLQGEIEVITIPFRHTEHLPVGGYGKRGHTNTFWAEFFSISNDPYYDAYEASNYVGDGPEYWLWGWELDQPFENDALGPHGLPHYYAGPPDSGQGAADVAHILQNYHRADFNYPYCTERAQARPIHTPQPLMSNLNDLVEWNTRFTELPCPADSSFGPGASLYETITFDFRIGCNGNGGVLCMGFDDASLIDTVWRFINDWDFYYAFSPGCPDVGPNGIEVDVVGAIWNAINFRNTCPDGGAPRSVLPWSSDNRLKVTVKNSRGGSTEVLEIPWDRFIRALLNGSDIVNQGPNTGDSPPQIHVNPHQHGNFFDPGRRSTKPRSLDQLVAEMLLETLLADTGIVNTWGLAPGLWPLLQPLAPMPIFNYELSVFSIPEMNCSVQYPVLISLIDTQLVAPDCTVPRFRRNYARWREAFEDDGEIPAPWGPFFLWPEDEPVPWGWDEGEEEDYQQCVAGYINALQHEYGGFDIPVVSTSSQQSCRYPFNTPTDIIPPTDDCDHSQPGDGHDKPEGNLFTLLENNWAELENWPEENDSPRRKAASPAKPRSHGRREEGPQLTPEQWEAFISWWQGQHPDDDDTPLRPTNVTVAARCDVKPPVCEQYAMHTFYHPALFSSSCSLWGTALSLGFDMCALPSWLFDPAVNIMSLAVQGSTDSWGWWVNNWNNPDYLFAMDTIKDFTHTNSAGPGCLPYNSVLPNGVDVTQDFVLNYNFSDPSTQDLGLYLAANTNYAYGVCLSFAGSTYSTIRANMHCDDPVRVRFGEGLFVDVTCPIHSILGLDGLPSDSDGRQELIASIAMADRIHDGEDNRDEIIALLQQQIALLQTQATLAAQQIQDLQEDEDEENEPTPTPTATPTPTSESAEDHWVFKLALAAIVLSSVTFILMVIALVIVFSRA